MTTLTNLPNDPWQSQATRQFGDSLRQRIQKLQAESAKTEALRREIAEKDADMDLVADANALREFRLVHLLEELSIREAMRPFLKARRADRSAENAAARKALEATKADVRAKLLSIGYVEGLIGNHQCISPGMIMMHPEVCAAQARARNTASGSDAAWQDNEAAIDELRRQIHKIKVAALAA